MPLASHEKALLRGGRLLQPCAMKLLPTLALLALAASPFCRLAPAQELIAASHPLRVEGTQSDFPALALDAQGRPWVAYVAWDGKRDTLRVARQTEGSLTAALTLGQPGIIHQPALAADGSGVLHVVWSQVNERDLVDLKTQAMRDGQPVGEVATLAASEKGGNAFAQAATDRAGRVWVVWQGMRGALADVFCRFFDPATSQWSPEVQVTHDPAGDWEPCVAFDDRDGAWVLYDSARGNEYNIYATRVSLDGKVGETRTLIRTPRYEARVSAIGTPDGKGIWLACERGNEQWGLDMRAHGGFQGLNGRKDSVLAYWDLASGKVEEMPPLDPLLDALPGPRPSSEPKVPRGNNPEAIKRAEERARQRAETARAAGRPAPDEIGAVNLPHVMLDAGGQPWVAVRYFKGYCWQIALARFDRAAKQWTRPHGLPGSVYTQDRRTGSALGKDGSLWMAWPTDLRTSKLQQTTGIHLAKVSTGTAAPLEPAAAPKERPPFAAYINAATPERARDDRHTWTHGGTTYKLYWGDYHRHTDISNCVTANDGCVLEQFRYALDMGKLDTLGTSDHTDIAKIYHPYEWWLNQKMVDVFYAPGFFASMYAYEREQKWPYGHRNIVFAQRGGPIVYIQRANYLASPWQKSFPVKAEGEKELMPEELWDVLTRYGKPVTAISHTGATGMGTDWNIFKTIDHRVENVIEIYQGARVSYEGQGAPQPTVGMREGQPYNHASSVVGKPTVGKPIPSFTERNNGLYQNALSLGHKLGVWANSDHISTHTSYGGVYVKEFTREGIIEGLNARRTVAATDKIFVEFSCNERLLGSELEVSGHPTMTFAVRGTADLSRVTLVRNEQNYMQWEPKSRNLATTYTDPSPNSGENRYYLRIEQADGNMAWSSPVWVQAK
jgi:hypothetical protein